MQADCFNVIDNRLAHIGLLETLVPHYSLTQHQGGIMTDDAARDALIGRLNMKRDRQLLSALTQVRACDPSPGQSNVNILRRNPGLRHCHED